LLSEFDSRVLEEIYKSTNIPINVREAMLIEAIYLAETKNLAGEVDRLCGRFIANRLEAVNYEGGYIRPKENEIKAQGFGKVEFSSVTYEGQFEDGVLQKTGDIKATYIVECIQKILKLAKNSLHYPTLPYITLQRLKIKIRNRLKFLSLKVS